METFLTFVLGKELFAVNVKNVLEVLEHQQVTKVPKVPEHILGILNFRGEILPVVNTHRKFNLDVTDELSRNIIIVYDIQHGDNHFAIAATADGVKDVIEIDPSEIKPVPEMGISYDARFIAGAIRNNENFTLFIHPELVFSVSDVEVAKKENQLVSIIA